MLTRLVAPVGRHVLDIGCGTGSLVRELTALGAQVTGLEISEQQLATARARDPSSSARYVVGSAQELPFDDGSVDVAVFMRSLHHVPPDELMAALREACRVVTRAGTVYVAEPVAAGEYFALTRLVEDEVEVRAAAQAALERAGEAGLDRLRTVDYDVRVCVHGLEGLRERIVSVDPRRAEIFEARIDELAAAFASRGERGQGPEERCFVQPMRADLLQPQTP
jgi:SAM-dependent methyltransferase